jgi:uncharacterized membrane protein
MRWLVANSNEVHSDVAEHVAKTVEELQRLSEHDQRQTTASIKLANRIAAVSGSMPFVAAHVVWFTIWVAMNLPDSPIAFDGFPFSFLAMVVSLEAIFLSLFVLMSENRQAERDERHSVVDLQVNLIAERELTKVLTMVSEIRDALGLTNKDSELEEMTTETHVEDLLEAVEESQTRG